MRKNYFLFIILALFVCTYSYSQISQGGTPPSIKYNIESDNIDMITIPAPDLTQVHIEDAKNDQNKGQYRVAVMIDTDLNMKNSGTWTDLPDGGKIWRLKIHSKGAMALNLVYYNFYIPPGGELYLYNKNQKQIIGAFTNLNNSAESWFATEVIQGDYVTLEYYQPSDEILNNIDPAKRNNYKIDMKKGNNREVSIEIVEIGYNYRGVGCLIGKYSDDKGFGDSQYCQININCPGGANWQNQKRCVALTMSSGLQCTGALVNNTNNNFTPYFLTADHCDHPNPASSMFYFNYEAPGCTNPPSAPSANSRQGATIVASGGVSGGSDFKLLLLNSNVPESYNPFFCGWNRLGTAALSGVGIHHPSGDIKKISTFSSSLQSSTWGGDGGGLTGGHWRVYWSSGVTEGGSSGSPIFDANGRIVGTLTGGGSYCNTPQYPDYYGKFSAHWDLNGTANNKRLKPWLDPTNSGVTSLDGIDYSSQPLNANFTGSPTTVEVGGTVNFSCTSTGNITSRSWSFPGGTPNSSTAQNQTVTYNTTGTYNVSLTVSGGGSSDTETKNNYITVTEEATSCVMLNYPLPGTEALYGVEGGGYVSGNNGYGDKTKAGYFLSSGDKEVPSMLIHIGAVDGTTGNVEFAIWNNNGTGGAPGTKLGSKTITMATLSAAFSEPPTPYTVNFDNPIPVNGNFYAGFFTSTGSDFAVTSNTHGDAPNATYSWEMWTDNEWYDFSAWNNGAGLDIHLAIFPEVCPIVNIENLTTETKINIYPNPAKNIITITNAGNANILIYNILGEVVHTTEKASSYQNIDTSKLPNGTYFIEINSEVFKINIIK